MYAYGEERPDVPQVSGVLRIKPKSDLRPDLLRPEEAACPDGELDEAAASTESTVVPSRIEGFAAPFVVACDAPKLPIVTAAAIARGLSHRHTPTPRN